MFPGPYRGPRKESPGPPSTSWQVRTNPVHLAISPKRDLKSKNVTSETGLKIKFCIGFLLF